MKNIDEICNNIGFNLRKARDAKRLSQAEVAKAMNIAQSQYGKVETGKVIPSIKTIITAAQVLEVGVEEILFGIKTNSTQLEIQESELIEKLSIISSLDDADKTIALQLIDLIIAKKTLKDISENLHSLKK